MDFDPSCSVHSPGSSKTTPLRLRRHQYAAVRRRWYAKPAAHNLYKAKRTTINGSGRFRDAGTTLKLYFSTGRPYVVHLYTTAP